MGVFLEMGAPTFGTAITELRISAHFRSTDPPRKTLEDSYAYYHKFLERLPKYRFSRRKYLFEVEFESKVGTAEYVTEKKIIVGAGAAVDFEQVWPDYRASLFNSFFAEVSVS